MRIAIFVLGALFATMSTAAIAGGVQDGSFETPSVADGKRMNFAPGAALGDWTVTGTKGKVILTSTDYTAKGYGFSAQNGKQWLNLGGKGGNMGVQQSFAVKPGLTYTISFWIGSMYATKGTNGTSSAVTLTIDGSPVDTFTFNAVDNGAKEQQWKQFSVQVSSGNKTVTIGFVNADKKGDLDCGLDQVQTKGDMPRSDLASYRVGGA